MGELQRGQRRPPRRAPAVVRVIVVGARRRVRRPRGRRRGGGGGAGGPPLDPLDEIGRRLDLVVVEEGDDAVGIETKARPDVGRRGMTPARDEFVGGGGGGAARRRVVGAGRGARGVGGGGVGGGGVAAPVEELALEREEDRRLDVVGAVLLGREVLGERDARDAGGDDAGHRAEARRVGQAVLVVVVVVFLLLLLLALVGGRRPRARVGKAAVGGGGAAGGQPLPFRRTLYFNCSGVLTWASPLMSSSFCGSISSWWPKISKHQSAILRWPSKEQCISSERMIG